MSAIALRLWLGLGDDNFRHLRTVGQYFQSKHLMLWSNIVTPYLLYRAQVSEAFARADRKGQAEAHLGLPAKLGTIMHAIAPSATSEALSLVDRLLPSVPPTRAEIQKWRKSSPLRRKTSLRSSARKAEVTNNH